MCLDRHEATEDCFSALFIFRVTILLEDCLLSESGGNNAVVVEVTEGFFDSEQYIEMK